MATTNKCLVAAAVIGVLLVVLGGISIPVIDTIIHNEVVKNVILYKNTSIGFQNWENISGIYIDYYFFTLTNKAEVIAGAKPALVEMGPYSYKQIKPKIDIAYGHEKETVNYTNLDTYIFDPVRSNGNPADIITTLNIPLMTIAEQIKYWNSFEQKAILGLVAWYEDEDIFYDISVQDILWGYEDPLLKLVQDVEPNLVPDAHFGFMYNRNNTQSKLWQIGTGKNDIMQVGKVVSYNDMDHLQWWNSEEANAIKGSDGTYNHPFWSRDRDEYIFSSDICRSVPMRYKRDSTVHGIPTYKFTAPLDALESGKTNPSNAGFCVPDVEHCLPDGLLNISRCQHGAPVIMSFPHFLFVDKEVQQKVHGLFPDLDKHEVYINVEPHTGVALEGALRMQFNIWMEKFIAVDKMKNLPTLPFPVMWANQYGSVSADKAKVIKSYLATPIFIANIAKWVVIALGAAILSIVIFLVIHSTRKTRRKTLSNGSTSFHNSINNGDEAVGQTADTRDSESKPLLC